MIASSDSSQEYHYAHHVLLSATGLKPAMLLHAIVAWRPSWSDCDLQTRFKQRVTCSSGKRRPIQPNLDIRYGLKDPKILWPYYASLNPKPKNPYRLSTRTGHRGLLGGEGTFRGQKSSPIIETYRLKSVTDIEI